MKSYAYYDKDGTIKKIISTTNPKIAKLNLTSDESMIKVPIGTDARTSKIVDGKLVPAEQVKPIPLKPAEPDPENVVVEKEVTINKLKPSEVDAWVDGNIKSLDDVKSVLKQVLKLQAKRPMQTQF